MDAPLRRDVFMAGKKKALVYENIKVLSMRGELIFRCDSKKAGWYLSRDLAVQRSSNIIQLTFETKGVGHLGDEYMVEERANQCVVCGDLKGVLTLHHVVPAVYRKYMPTSIKSHSSRDLLLLCKYCHNSYEASALGLKREIAEAYGIPLEGKGWIKMPENGPVKRAAAALIRQRRLREGSGHHGIPPDRLKTLEETVRGWWVKSKRGDHQGGAATGWEPTDEILKEAADLRELVRSDDFVEHGEYVVGQLTREPAERGRWPELERFIRMWRQHFLDHAQPRHLSELWSVDGEIYTGC